VASDLLASSVQCDARSLAENLPQTTAESGQNVVESVTPEYSAPDTALTALHLNLHLNLSDLTLQLPQTWPCWPCPLWLCPCLCLWLAAPGSRTDEHGLTPAPRRPWPPSRPSRPPSLHGSACGPASRPQSPFPSFSRDPSLFRQSVEHPASIVQERGLRCGSGGSERVAVAHR